MKLSLVIPCYNESKVISETFNRVSTLAGQWRDESLISDYEFIFVDDGSTDDTFDQLNTFAQHDPRVKVLSFSNNFGHQPALLAGLHHATGDAAVSLDADLQDPPETIREMIQKVNDGAEIVYAVRSSRETDTVFKRTTARCFYRVMRFCKVPLLFDHADFRLMTRPVLEALKQFTEVNLFLRGMFPLMGFKSEIVYFKRQQRFAGETKYPLGKMVSFAIQGITSFSYFPLRISFFLGLAIFVLSILFTVYALVSVALGRTVPGWASIVIPLYLFGGLQFIILGIIGEYIGRIYQEVKRRPVYIIREKINL